MTSKKTAKSKRASPPREFTRTKEFKKDWQRLSHSGRYPLKAGPWHEKGALPKADPWHQLSVSTADNPTIPPQVAVSQKNLKELTLLST